MTVAEFSERARAAIYAVCDDRCAGCLATSPLTAQHRRARGRGGSSDRALSSPANGVPLCGSGTTGCHGWAEAHPVDAALLGWRLEAGDDPLEVPIYLRPYGWRRYELETVELVSAGGARRSVSTLLHVYAEVGEAQLRALDAFLAQLRPAPLPSFLRPPKGNR